MDTDKLIGILGDQWEFYHKKHDDTLAGLFAFAAHIVDTEKLTAEQCYSALYEVYEEIPSQHPDHEAYRHIIQWFEHNLGNTLPMDKVAEGA